MIMMSQMIRSDSKSAWVHMGMTHRSKTQSKTRSYPISPRVPAHLSDGSFGLDQRRLSQNSAFGLVCCHATNLTRVCEEVDLLRQ